MWLTIIVFMTVLTLVIYAFTGGSADSVKKKANKRD